MAEILPFRALRYRDDLPLADVTAPPYDVLTAERAAALRARSPFNVVHVDLPADPGRTAAPADYRRCADLLRRWRDEGVLQRDAEASVYLLEQSFLGPDHRRRTRRGFFARLVLEDLASGVVRPHERTHTGPKQDRLELYRATHTDVSPVFLLAPDDDGALTAALSEAASAAGPWREYVDDEGTRQRLAAVGAGAAGRLAAVLAGRPVYIADGHHRYETALAYRDERRAAGDHSADTLLVYLCSTADPGLAVFPTHRLVRGTGLPGFDEVCDRCRRSLTPLGEPLTGAETCRKAFARIHRHRHAGVVLGVYDPRTARGALFAIERTMAAGLLGTRGYAPAVATLPSAVAHELVLGDALGLTPAQLEERVEYAKSLGEAFARLTAGGFGLAVFLDAIPVASVREVADQGLTMPQKSTFFAPKVPTGLVLDPLGD